MSGTAPEGCVGAIVEIFKNGEAYVVELFDGCVTLADRGSFEADTRDVANFFMETIGVETASSTKFAWLRLLAKPSASALNY